MLGIYTELKTEVFSLSLSYLVVESDVRPRPGPVVS